MQFSSSVIQAVSSNGRTRSDSYFAGLGTWAETASYIGRDSNPSNAHCGLISEILVYDSILSDADRISVERYLSHKYDIQIAKTLVD